MVEMCFQMLLVVRLVVVLRTAEIALVDDGGRALVLVGVLREGEEGERYRVPE